MRFNIYTHTGKQVDEHFNVNAQQVAMIFAPKRYSWLNRLLHHANETQAPLTASVEVGKTRIQIETVKDQ